MKIISTKLHGVLDYVVGIILIASPWIFNFDNGTAAQWVPVIIGIMVLLMSLMTNYELGMIKKIPMATHLTMDVIAGIILALSPWIFGFADQVYLPHLVIGIFSIGTGLMTERVPHGRAASHDHSHGHSNMRHAH